MLIEPDTPESQTMLSFQPILDLFANDDRYELLGHISEYFGSTNRTLHIWTKRGVSLIQAEKLAEKIGLHPSIIWGADYHTAVYYEMNRQIMLDKATIRRKKERDKNAASTR